MNLEAIMQYFMMDFLNHHIFNLTNFQSNSYKSNVKVSSINLQLNVTIHRTTELNPNHM